MAHQCSQNSQASTCSIPSELFDQEFIFELEPVEELFFGNVQNSDGIVSSDDDDGGNDDDDSDADIDDGYAQLPAFSTDDPEDANVEKFRTQGCGCTKLYGKQCSEVIKWSKLIEYRQSCLEKTKDELDLIVKVQLFHSRNTRKDNIQSKTVQNYFFHGQRVCRYTFAFAHALFHKTVERIGRSLDIHGLTPRVHGNVGKAPKHALSLTDVQHIKQFLVSYGVQNGVPLPGRMPNFRNEKCILLPSDRNKADIHSLYCSVAEGNGFRKVCLSEFRKIWNEQCPYLLIMKPATDLCVKCQKYVDSITHSGNFTEEEKIDKLNLYQNHLDKVKCQRDYYRQQCEATKVLFADLSVEEASRGQFPAVRDTTIHYSFDYAQQVMYPHYAQQVGPLYFKTPRKCGCFGVCCESSGSQIFYLVDEEHSTAVGRGANSVVSMIHHHFQYHSYGEKKVALHMDNCSGQNKNNAVLGYGMWRVMTGLHDELEYSLMEAGHTKFSPEWHFGLWKVRWRHTSAENMEDIAKTVADSSRNGHNIPQLVDDPVKPVVFYEWTGFLKQFFKPLLGLKKYHHYRMTRTKPGVIYVKEYATDDEVEVNILKHGVNLTGKFPERIQIPELDAKRQWYLYDEIAPLCNNSCVCPRPMVPRPVNVKNEHIKS